MDLPRDQEHTLNVQAVEMRTAITAETLRTWERRYGWPRPHRLSNGYRVYSEDDVALILAVKRELDAGVAAGTAWQRVLATRQHHAEPQNARAQARLRADLTAAALSFDRAAMTALIAEAHALYPLERVLIEIMQPALVEIGDRWHAGDVSVAQEHFATSVLRDSLVTIANLYHHRPGAAAIVIGAAPGELHDVGVLMLSLLLRRSGHNAIYLGQSVALEQLARTLEQIRPRLLLLSASREETARALKGFAPIIAHIDPPRTLFGFGGRAFAEHPELAERIGGTYVPGDAVSAAARLEEMLADRPRR